MIVGKMGRYISAGEAYEYVAGYSIFNDVSDRGFIPKKDRMKREWDPFFDWYHGKLRDTFAP